MPDERLTYLSIDSISEGIGFSQVLAYVERIAGRGLQVDLHTFEKARPSQELHGRLRAAGVEWHPHHFGRFGSLAGLARVVRGSRAVRNAGLVHARSDLPAMSTMLARVENWVWDVRSLYADQKIELGEVVAGSVQHKVLQSIERAAAVNSTKIITLTEAVIPELVNRYGESVAPKTTVITTCVDTSRFQLSAAPRSDQITFLLAGTLNAFYDVTLMTRLISACRARRPTRLELAVPHAGRLDPRLATVADKTEVVQPEDMPDTLRRCHVGLSVCRSDAGISLRGSMPTKIGEFLATGRPVVVNQDLGDAGKLLKDSRCGIALKGRTPSDISESLDGLDELLADPETPERCRALALRHFDLDEGVGKLLEVYQQARMR